jgi:hypothetical protein
MLLISGVYAYDSQDPVLYLNFNEGSSIYALDSSGSGTAGTLFGASRIDRGSCGRALFFNGTANYVAVPFSQKNHPEKGITVSAWFYSDSYNPQVLISTYNDGGYRLGFDDGQDLWWTVNLEKSGDLSIPIQHENIVLNQWHYITGTYDGKVSKIYLDGILRNQVNASGTIRYTYDNYVMLGASAGTGNTPDPTNPQYFRGGLDDVRIYDRAISYSDVMDDRFSCSQTRIPLIPDLPPGSYTQAYGPISTGPISVHDGSPVFRTLSFENKTEITDLNVVTEPGSMLSVKGFDRYSTTSPDAWYIEIADEHGRINRAVAFPNTNNAPVTGIIPSGNATVYVHYFNGGERFPATVTIQLESIVPTQIPIIIPPKITFNPIIVIYSASWATLIALILVMIWLHRRKKAAGTIPSEVKESEKL